MATTDTLLLDADLRIRATTPGLAAALGLPPDAVGARLAEVLPDGDPLAAEARAARDGAAVPPREVSVADGGRRDVTVARLGDGVVVTVVGGREAGQAAAEFRALIEASSQVVWQTDAEGRSVGESPTWSAFTGQTREASLGDGWMDAVHPDDRAGLADVWRAAVQAERGYVAEFRVWHAASGAWRWMAARAAPLFRPDGTFEGHVGMNADVTERREQAEALAASEARFRAMADTVPDGLFTADPTGEIGYANAQFRALTGVDPARLDTLADWLALIHPDDAEAALASWQASLASGDDARCRYRFRRPDGGWRWVETRARAVTGPDGAVTTWYGATTDVDGLVRAERALARANATLEARVAEETATVRRLAAELTVAEQAERRRIAQVLHDDLQQHLYGTAMLVTVARTAPDDLDDLLRRCQETLNAGIALTRTLLSDLSPTALESEDVCDVVRWLADEVEGRYGLVVAVEADGPCVVPALAVRSLAYQCARELLFNVVKHGGARAATVRLACADGTLELDVTDDGAGFAPGDVEEGFGLTTLRDRLALAGGRLDLASAPDAGTHATIILPAAP